MSLFLKKGVSLIGLQPPMTAALVMISSIDPWATIVITSATDAAAGRIAESLHPKGLAIDVRWPQDDQSYKDSHWWKSQLVSMFEDTEYDLVLYETHFHLEYDPK